MLFQFSVQNFKTFKEKATLSLVASNNDKDTRAEENISETNSYNLKILKSAVIYGANASGKSKFIEALMFMKHFAINSSRETQKGEKIDIEPFLLSNETEEQPSEFEVIFLYKNDMFRYGFEVNKNVVVSEWLFHKPKTTEVELFYRDFQDFETHPRNFSKGTTLVREKLIRDNALLLSVGAQFNDHTCEDVIEWFKSLKTISGLNEEGYHGYTLGKTKDNNNKKRILELLKSADLGIQDIKLEMEEIAKFPKDMPIGLTSWMIRASKEENSEIVSDVLTTHKKYDENKKHIGNISFSLENDESFGTRKFFALTGPVLDALENGYTLVVDELDSKLHPNLVCKIVSLFNSKTFNPKNAQLVFNTHDTNLLSSGLFRKDQVWFTEKDKYGAAKLYSLADFKSDTVRKNEAFEDNYIRGKYGAVPFLGFFDNLINKNLLPQDEK
jgi:AAA15 family ATPase/GTPase